MNKKREALRRGLRSFIADTSRELADLEGRDLQPSPPPEESRALKKSDDATSRPASAGGAAPRRPSPDQGEAAPAAQGTSAAAAPTAGTSPPQPSPAPGEPAARPTPPPAAVVLPIEAPQTVAPEPVVNEIRERTPVRDAPPPLRTDGVAPQVPLPVVEHPTATNAQPEPPEIHDGQVPRPERRPAKAPRRAPGPARKRPRPRTVADIGANGVSAEQAHARRGVCFAYFLNHECWRVPDAYCLTALHVCITRECPVYHLHRETLERRFAKKFKHFW